jgi:hypothetical protein
MVVGTSNLVLCSIWARWKNWSTLSNMSLSRISKIGTELDSELIIGGNWFLELNGDALILLFDVRFGGRLTDLLQFGQCDREQTREAGWSSLVDGPVPDLTKGAVGRTNDELTRFSERT